MESTVEADKAAVETAKVNLSYCYIYAPVTGRVGSLLVNEGNLVRASDASGIRPVLPYCLGRLPNWQRTAFGFEPAANGMDRRCSPQYPASNGGQRQ